ncbi:DgyrCDS7262 [Dimorphilus gyrociliatus]|uniref:X-box-binding protein 1 n=1 Tax=Dimorphilus gyrociliatus TaxID=2664684 RepID=A0A7I8VQQ6_9ANNE|nr:DgyrCDS7262 [Dimorphilus gyrociliatus]
MATIIPRTVIIEPSINLKRPFIDNGGGYEAAAEALAQQDDFLDCDEHNSGTTCRKRRRLTVLTAEERLLRRKLKNRVAAQVARDRKKQKMSELELMIENLEKQNQLLRRENQELRDEVKRANKETDQLRCCLNDETTRRCKDEPDLLQQLVDEITNFSETNEENPNFEKHSSKAIQMDHQYSRSEDESFIATNKDERSEEEEEEIIALDDDLKELQELSLQLLEDNKNESYPLKFSPEPDETEASSSDESGFLSDDFISDVESLFSDLFPCLS